MSEGSAENNLSYQDVVKVADIISKSGKKVRIDEVRSEIGYGDYAQIAAFLRRWQNSNEKINDRPQHKAAAKANTNRQKPQNQNSSNFYQYDDASSYTFHSNDVPFSIERFLKESESVKALFIAICCVKQDRNEVLEGMRKLKANTLSFYKQSDRDIRRIKMDARDKVRSLNSEFTKIYVSKEQEKSRLKEAIS